MKFRLILLSVLLFSCLQGFSQQDSIGLNTIISKANDVAQGIPIEKVYLHFDKPYYAVGDTMWFKAYLTAGFHQPSELSKIVYVDVISSRDSLVKSLILPVTDGTATGSVALIKPFRQDNYHIKAYTKWMLNFEQTYFFNKTISVGDAADKEVSATVSLKRTISNKLPQINAEIVFKDAEGNPYANKKVEWYANSGIFDAIADGKGTTDQKGVLNISFVNSKSADLSKATLTTSLDAGKKNYEQTFSLKSVSTPADVQFFPEGGSLYTGIPTKIAVKAIQSNGLGIDFTGTVTDNTGNTIVSCNSQYAGMGAFVLTPLPGKRYKMNINFKDGSQATYDLPESRSGGFTLSVNNTDTSKIVVRLMADSTYLKNHLHQTYYLVGKSGQTILYAAQTSLVNPVYTASIPSSKFPTGIAQLTLLTSSGLPLSERIVFVRHRDQMDVAINTDKKTYGSRQRVQLSVLTKNSQAPAEANLSVAVIDESKVPVNENSETTILNNLLLTSDLKGYIENPNHYFSQENMQSAMADLDLLMLTQGYRRFTYQEILTNKLPRISYLPEQGIEISGTLRTLNGMPFKGGRVTLQIPDRYFVTETVSDVQGRFKFSNLVFTDSTKIVVHARNNVNAKSLMIMIDGTPYPALEKNPNYPDEELNIDTMMTAYLQNVKKIYENSRVLKEVVINSKAPKVASFADYSNLAGLSSVSANRISDERLKGCTTLLNCLQSMSLGVGITYDSETQNFYVTRNFTAGYRVPMAISVKGLFVEVMHLNSINPQDVESVEVFLKDDMGLVDRANQTSGVIVVNMKPDVKVEGTKVSLQQLQDLIPQPNVIKMTPEGYNVTKEFYSPRYLAGTPAAFGPDLRTTIYWNPHLITDSSGKAAVDFYTADGKGNYRVIVEGLDKQGHIARSVYRFKVE